MATTVDKDWPQAVRILERCGTLARENPGYQAFESPRLSGLALAYLPMVMEERARLTLLTGEATTAARQLREAHRLYEEIGATGHAPRLAKELGP